MEIKLIRREKEGELLLIGRLDSSSAPEAEDILMAASEEFEKIVLNLSGLQYISSAGLRVFKNLYFAMNKKNGELVLKNTNKMVMEVFEITGFAGILRFE